MKELDEKESLEVINAIREINITLDRIEAKMETGFNRMEKRFDGIEAQMERIEAKTERIEAKVSSLKNRFENF